MGCFSFPVHNLLCTFGIGDCMSLSGENMGDDLVRLYAFVFVSSSMADAPYKTCSRCCSVTNWEFKVMVS